ncbi:MAG: hypothetical protein FWE43_01755 [Streptococcaceae bacterium]|jgi:translation initiation factor 2B subunit (eIF-2B alpha/beta/delta family)|nr:hypothetical protein [Streptococcaceae bacterium]MCL2681194.1 hypothetical protein [Streptococcaceae bacterium]
MDRQEARKKEAAINANFQQLERQSRQLDNQITRNKQQLRKIEQVEMVITDLSRKQNQELEALHAGWKGKEAQSLLTEASMNQQRFYRQYMRKIHDRKRIMTEANREFYKKQDELMKAKRIVVRGGR